jgi:hypothetical protein
MEEEIKMSEDTQQVLTAATALVIGILGLGYLFHSCEQDRRASDVQERTIMQEARLKCVKATPPASLHHCEQIFRDE